MTKNPRITSAIARLGRSRRALGVLIGCVIRSALKLSAEDSPLRGSRRDLDLDVAPDRAEAVAAALRELRGHFANHPNILAVIDAGVAGVRPFIATGVLAGDPLDEALAAYGPAALADALPRLRLLAEALDLGAAHGMWHGMLEPRDIIVSVEATALRGLGLAPALARAGVAPPASSPYAAPEIAVRGRSGPAADQYALAAIAYEWVFGRAIDGPADAPVHVPSLQGGIDQQALADAFTRGLAREPGERFASCTALVNALTRAAEPAVVAIEDARRLGARVEQPVVAASVEDLPIRPEPVDAADVLHAPEPVSLATVTVARPVRHAKNRAASAAALIGGVAAGLLLAWVTVPWLLPADSPRVERGQAFTDEALAPAAVAPAADAPIADAPIADVPVSADVPVQSAPVSAPIANVSETQPDRPAVTRAMHETAPARTAAAIDAALLVHSTPSGATVVVDGVERGTTPVAVRGLALGTRMVSVRRSGYRPAQQAVSLTANRPSRTLEIALQPVARPQPPRPAIPTAGRLVIDSRPTGAQVTLDGRPVGVTPLVLDAVTPGTRSVRIERAGYRPVMTSVEVKAGGRARVAARLEGGRNEP